MTASPRLTSASARRARVAARTVGALLFATASAVAQSDSTAQAGGRWLISASVGVPGTGRDAVSEALTVGVQWTQLEPKRLVGDFAIGTMPRALAHGVAVGGLRAGLAFPLLLSPRTVFLPSGGVSLVGVLGNEGRGGATGFNAGLATVLLDEGGTGLRVGMTWHRFGRSEVSVWLLELGIVFPQSRRSAGTSGA